MGLARLSLRSVPYPYYDCSSKPPQTIATSKPPLHPFYDRVHSLNLLTLEYYLQHLKKRRGMALQKVATRLPLPTERQPPTPSSSTPYEKALTQNTVRTGPTRLEKIFEKPSTGGQHVPTRQKSKPSNFLGGLLYKARVGPNQLIRRADPLKTAVCSDRRGCTPNGTRTSCVKKADKRVAHRKIPKNNRVVKTVPRGRKPSGRVQTGNNQSDRANRKNSSARHGASNSQTVTPVPRQRSVSVRDGCRSRMRSADGPPIPRRVAGKKRYATCPPIKSTAIVSRPVKKHRVGHGAGKPKSTAKRFTDVGIAFGRDDARCDLSTGKSVSRPVNKNPVNDVNDVTKANPLRKHDTQTLVSPTKKIVSSAKKTVLPTAITNATASGRKQSQTINLSKLAKTTASRPTAPVMMATPVMESPVSITQNPFLVAEFNLAKANKKTPVANRVRRGLSFERRPRKASTPLLFIADPREEHKIQSAFDAAHVKTLDERPSGSDNRSQHSGSHDWEITFV